ncbi:hypothetical protein J6590_060696 [Homalodisca vitripennis]|nr:hypothetical protein J6590_060696 [Homalodisca vitripennis]
MEDKGESSTGRKKKCESEWKRNVIKRARVKGLEYIDYKKKTVPAVTSGPHCGKCTEILREHKDDIFVRLRSLETKNEQDIFLQSLISSHNVKQHRPRKEGEGSRLPHEKSFTYNVMVGEEKRQGTKVKMIVLNVLRVTGLTLASGLVVFVSSDPQGPLPALSLRLVLLHGGSSIRAVRGGCTACDDSVSEAVSHSARPWLVVSTMVPGADRRLQERQLCKEFLVKTANNPDMLRKSECDGPFLANKTPPKIFSTNILAEEKNFHLSATTVSITLMHKRPPNSAYPGQPITFQLPTSNFPRYATIGSCTIVHQEPLVGISNPYPGQGNIPPPSMLNTKRSGSPSSLSRGYCSGGTSVQPIIIHSNEEIL